MNSDMAIIREWAEAKVSGRHFATDCDLKVARYILATTPSPTMADVDWDDAVHAGLCAEHPVYGVVLMIGPDLVVEGSIICHWAYCDSPVTGRLMAEHLTPIPGTKIDLTPRREPVPEPTPEHPEVLTTEEDYESAPVGTVVEYDGDVAVKRDNGQWQWTGQASMFWSEDFAEGDPCTVVRWGK